MQSAINNQRSLFPKAFWRQLKDQEKTSWRSPSIWSIQLIKQNFIHRPLLLHPWPKFPLQSPNHPCEHGKELPLWDPGNDEAAHCQCEEPDLEWCREVAELHQLEEEFRGLEDQVGREKEEGGRGADEGDCRMLVDVWSSGTGREKKGAYSLMSPAVWTVSPRWEPCRKIYTGSMKARTKRCFRSFWCSCRRVFPSGICTCKQKTLAPLMLAIEVSLKQVWSTHQGCLWTFSYATSWMITQIIICPINGTKTFLDTRFEVGRFRQRTEFGPSHPTEISH